MQRFLARAAGPRARGVKLLQLLPEAPPAHALAFALNAGICIGLVSRGALEPLLGKTVSLEASDLGLRVRVAYEGSFFRACAGGAPAAAALAARQRIHCLSSMWLPSASRISARA